MAQKAQDVDLLGTVDVLHRYLTVALCQSVFDRIRRGERERTWSLALLAEFWTAVILRAPPSLTHALAEATGGQAGYPQTEGTDQGFFARCKTLSVDFFQALFEAFTRDVTRCEPARFCAESAHVTSRFEQVLVVDGSTLDQVARRLKILWADARIPLPGSIVALYDVQRGILQRLDLDRYAEGKEQLGARRVLAHVPPKALCLADALYGLPFFFQVLTERGAFGLSRRNRRANLTLERRLSSRRYGAGRIEDWVVRLGTGRDTPIQRLRLIRWKEGSKSLELLTNVMDPEKLRPEEALELFRKRWSVERLFFDLKEVLNLHRIYAANFNAVGMQVFASAIVHTAMRVAQSRIAHEHDIEPERISPAKLFPKIAAASTSLVTAEVTWDEICRLNPQTKLIKPTWDKMPFARIPLSRVLVETRMSQRKRRKRTGTDQRRRLPRPPPRPVR